MPKRTKRPSVRRAKDFRNFGMGLSILWQLEPVKRRGVAYTGNGNCLATGKKRSYLTRKKFWVNCAFLMATIAPFLPAEIVADLDFPQREAAFFYGLFLRGHSPDQLRRDIEVPAAVIAKWHRDAEREPHLRDVFARMMEYRRHVLAIFDNLVGSDGQYQRLQ